MALRVLPANVSFAPIVPQPAENDAFRAADYNLLSCSGRGHAVELINFGRVVYASENSSRHSSLQPDAVEEATRSAIVGTSYSAKPHTFVVVDPLGAAHKSAQANTQ